jgi:hypothetical protein
VWTKNLHLEIVPEVSTTFLFSFAFNILSKFAARLSNDLASQRSQRHARIVNRNEPFGSILEAAKKACAELLSNR